MRAKYRGLVEELTAYADRVGTSSLPQRLVRAVGESPVAERVAHAQGLVYGPLIDWAEMTGAERRIGAVHALGTDIATFLHLASLLTRTRGLHANGTKLGFAGNLVMAGAGFLGGHLALNRGTARRTAAKPEHGSGEWAQQA